MKKAALWICLVTSFAFVAAFAQASPRSEPGRKGPANLLEPIASHPKISISFFNALSQVNLYLAGAVWAGVAEANSSNTAVAEVHLADPPSQPFPRRFAPPA